MLKILITYFGLLGEPKISDCPGSAPETDQPTGVKAIKYCMDSGISQFACMLLNLTDALSDLLHVNFRSVQYDLPKPNGLFTELAGHSADSDCTLATVLCYALLTVIPQKMLVTGEISHVSILIHDAVVTRANHTLRTQCALPVARLPRQWKWC